MNIRMSLIRMLKQLTEDTLMMQSAGAGYYTCIPLASRYNKLLGQTVTLFPSYQGLLSTFEKIAESDPKDPSDKMKVVQGIRIEISQLVALLESMSDDDAAANA
jgi:hypothetical protein